jgi:transposase-like protein
MPYFTHASTRAIPRPPCPKCGATMMMARIEPDVPGHDRRTFECKNCGNAKTEVVNRMDDRA